MNAFLESFKKLVLNAWELVKPRWKNIVYLLLVEMGIGFAAALIIGMTFVLFPGYSLLGMMALSRISPSLLLSSALRSPALWIMLLVALIVGLASLVLSSFVSLAFIVTLKENVQISFGKLLGESKAKYWDYFGALFLAGILIALASLIFIIPGILLAVMYFAVPFIVIETGLKNMAALKASFDLVKGNAWKVFSHILAFGFCMGIVSMIFRWLGPIGQLLSIAMPIASLAFTYELYKLLRVPTVQPELPAQQ
ncbi:MAG: hypothetical protein NTX26_00950 [Candidatus Parcubacteria bacterium]|nr:hypothetical protein [Candidatus Parcubacteria bacterium]